MISQDKLSIRIPTELKESLAQAARIQGKTVTSIMIGLAEEYLDNFFDERRMIENNDSE